ncbi:MAG: VOC family protein [Hyphomonadaceae bacterium]
MITGFDHVVIAVRDLEAGVAAYETLLGRAVSARSESDGAATALIATGNVAVELMALRGDGEAARRLRAALKDGEGLKSLVFATDDIEAMHRRAERTALAPEPIADRDAWRSFRIDKDCAGGARLFFLQRDAALAPAQPHADGVSALDHIVVRTPDPQRAVALYGGRLGLDLRLDRDVGGRRLMFFRCGDTVLEVAHEPELERDTLWGLCWRVGDIDAAQARLAAAGVNVSEVRIGMKPGTRVFTVRDRSCGVPTLMIGKA